MQPNHITTHATFYSLPTGSDRIGSCTPTRAVNTSRHTRRGPIVVSVTDARTEPPPPVAPIDKSLRCAARGPADSMKAAEIAKGSEFVARKIGGWMRCLIEVCDLNVTLIKLTKCSYFFVGPSVRTFFIIRKTIPRTG